jgi:potassium uptake TrkH family protein
VKVAGSGTRAGWALRTRAPRHPAQVVVGGFAFAILGGTALLMLPIAKAGSGAASFIQALFTSTSAVCVTGLTVVDTATFWSPIGQVIILLLIQLGGLGIMIFAALIGLILARRMSVRSRLNTATEAKIVGFSDLRGIVRGILLISLIIEAITFACLFARFLFGYGYDPGRAAWFGLFHAVSSFNNAGFALYTDNLVRFASDPFICLPICAAVIVGGLGFPVIMQLRKELRRPLHWSMNTKIVLWSTAVLLIASTLYLTVVEWSNPHTLGALNPWARVLAGFFQAVQTRTAGFNSVPIGQMRDESLIGIDVLMFIGAGPAGTAGGIKVTTLAVLLAIAIAELRGESRVNAFGRRIPRSVHRQAITVALVAASAVIAGAAILMFFSDEPLDRAVFETISAFGTVGLSTGITGDIALPGQLVLVILMFLGRLGPLTLGSAIALRERRILYEYPTERPAIG